LVSEINVVLDIVQSSDGRFRKHRLRLL
jgi:hypothetical protein